MAPYKTTYFSIPSETIKLGNNHSVEITYDQVYVILQNSKCTGLKLVPGIMGGS